MSRILIDTQAMIWLIEDDPRLPENAVALLDEAASIRLFSVASVWEMGIKIAIGKLRLKQGSLEDFLQLLIANEVEILPILAAEATDVATLPLNEHKDPFDRLIAAQCLRYDLTLLSVDPQFDPYGIRRVWN